ncbi:transglutaminase-like domain-containing protein [Paraliomyxa miuraensis]|uniref:transglutaminase-like domain-containing protein n=1 Tax=Paraliomyxa miuraensis TaxID=376150 RepID=UPI002259AC46|nr:transglutaminase family protein [Paraliomyxa miuraensis]MCX4241226.1 transglutaminase family protein [Paraliomyxa miuraensis]
MLRLSLVVGSLLWSLLLSGCARVPGGALTPLEPGQLSARVALAEAVPAQADPVEHALALAEAELALGRHDRAASLMALALRRGDVAWQIARMQGDEAAAKQARATLDRVARQARRMAAQTDDPQLMVAAVLADRHPRRHSKALRRAIVQGGRTLNDADLPRVLELVGSDHEARWWLGRSLYDEDREWLGLAPALGREGLRQAIEARGTPDALAENAAATLAADAWEVDAQLVRLMLDELAAGVLVEDPLLLDDLVGPFYEGRDRMARLHVRREAASHSRALGLALGWWLLRAELVGDAHGVLESLAVPEHESKAHHLHEQLRAMTAARRGDLASFERWRIRNGVRSASVDEWLAVLDHAGQGPALRTAAARARRRRARLEHPFDRPPDDYTLREAIVFDARLDARARERVRHWIPWGTGEAAAWRELCDELHQDVNTCASLWQHEDVMAGLALASGTRHLHPDALDVAGLDAASLAELEPLLRPYEDTVLAASPEYQGARLRIALATGDHAQARARLEDHGALLEPSLRTWAWLAIDDLAAGTASYDETNPWVPGFADEFEEPEEPVPPEPSAPLRTDRYRQGMQAAAQGRHAEALEHLLPVLDAVPDAAVSQGLAAAALAAHHAGKASVRDDLRVRLHAVDPHGSAYARMQAHLALAAGRPDEARRFLAHALRWSPDDMVLHRRMVALLAEGTAVADEPALDFVTRAPAEGRYHALRSRILRGDLRTLAEVDRVRRGLDGTPQDAWAVGPELLVHLPWLSETAARWGMEQIETATELETARRWAAQTLAMLEANPPPHGQARVQRLWLSLLLGRADEGLALAQHLDREHGLRPLSEGEGVVMLLRALEAAEIDDALVWDLWRWSYETDEDAMARVEALLLDPPKGSILQAFACGELVSREDASPAIPVCAEAWKAQPSLLVGISQSFLALSPPSPVPSGAGAVPEATAVLPNIAEVFATVSAPSFLEAPALALGENLAEPWYVNQAIWLAAQGRHEAAARAWWQAHAFGLADTSSLQDVVEQIRQRGLLIRAMQGVDEWMEPLALDLFRARLALAGAETGVARAYAEAARARGLVDLTRLARSQLDLPDRLRHLADWVEQDLAAGRLQPDALVLLADVVLEPELEPARQLHATHPEASSTRLALALAYRALDDATAARPVAEALLERHPDHPLAVAAVLPLWVAAGEDDRARVLYEASAAMHPGDLVLRHADVPESITGPHDGVPAWVRDPARFDERIARISDASVDALAPERHVVAEDAVELLVPAGWVPSEGKTLRFDDELGARMMVFTTPRASRCQGADCARDILDAFGGQGRTKQWMRQTTLAGLEATQILLTNTEEVAVMWVLPSGGRVFSLVMAAPLARFELMGSTVALLRDGFRPLDAVLPPFAAESLRAAGAGVDDRVRLAGRREQARAKPSAKPSTKDDGACPVPRALAALADDGARAELLVDLWLSTPDAGARRALVSCAEPRSAAAGRLALVALLDEDPRVHALGRRAVAQHPDRVTDDVRTILSTPLTPPVSAPDYLLRSDLPVHGLVEAIGALPDAHAGPLANRLAQSTDLHDRALAWAALQLRPELASDATIDAALADPSPRMVSDAAFLLAMRAGPGDAQRLREHLDATGPATSDDEQIVLRALARHLASFLEPQDHSRLAALAARVVDGDDPKRAKRTREELGTLARDHARALELSREPSPSPGPDDGRALSWRATQRRRSLPIRSETDLRTKSLAQLLPGHDYVFARLAAPGLFSSTVSDVVERLTTGDEAVDQRLGELGARMLRENGFAALSSSGGLDAAKPIECAEPADGYGWVCTARVTDRDALLAVLSQRSGGEDAGVSLPLTVATTAGVVPLALSLLPAILHPLVYPEDDDEPKGPNADEGAERARMVVVRGSMELQRYSIVEASTRRLSIDSERYLFVGDRLWVFSTEDAMERVLRKHEGPVLADSPELARLTADWKDGAALQAVALGRSWPWAKNGASVEVVVDETGLRFRYAGAFDSEQGIDDIGPALAQLPPGAVTSFAHGLGPMRSLEIEPLEAEGSDAGRVPPLSVLMAARGLAFGWYLRDGDRLWRRWLAVTPLDDALRKVLRRERITLGPAGKSRRQGALCYAQRSGAGPGHAYLLMGDCALVDDALTGSPPPAPSRDHLRVAHGTFDGPTAATALPGLDGLPIDQRMVLRAVAPLLGVVTDLSVEAHWSPTERVAVLEGHMAMRLRPPGDRGRVIDDWLAASEGHNAAALPRRLRDDEIEAPLRYVVEVPDAEDFVRHTLAESPRVQAEVLGPTRVRLTVSPAPAKGGTPAPLTEKRRKELTKRTDVLPIDDPRIVGVARRLAPKGTAPAAAAERIGAWVHERITYEITPRSLDGAQILEAGRGDCTEYARLTVTLLRAAGVPAEVRDGMAASGDELVAHAWVAYHDGERWHEIDPTWGRSMVSAGHLEMSVLDALALVSLGKLKVVEVTP